MLIFVPDTILSPLLNGLTLTENLTGATEK